jgi:hypothetical protein
MTSVNRAGNVDVKNLSSSGPTQLATDGGLTHAYGALTADGVFTANGAAVLNSTLSSVGATDLATGGGLTWAHGGLKATGAVDLATAGGLTHAFGAFTATGATTLSSTLHTVGAATFDADVTIAGNLKVDTLTYNQVAHQVSLSAAELHVADNVIQLNTDATQFAMLSYTGYGTEYDRTANIFSIGELTADTTDGTATKVDTSNLAALRVGSIQTSTYSALAAPVLVENSGGRIGEVIDNAGPQFVLSNSDGTVKYRFVLIHDALDSDKIKLAAQFYHSDIGNAGAAPYWSTVGTWYDAPDA